jgi:membrane protease YdiL (CAAX protease family)
MVRERETQAMIRRRNFNRTRFVANPRAEPERPADAWGPLATFGLGTLAALVGQVPPLLVFYYWHGPNTGHWTEIATDAPAVILFICLSTPVQVALLVWFAKKAGSTAVNYLALTLPSGRMAPLLPITALALLLAGDGLSAAFGRHVVTPFQSDIYRSAAKTGNLLWLWLTVVVVAPVGEEILFRGFLFRGWQRTRRSAAVAISSTALLWALIHAQYSLFEIGEVFIVGLIFGWVRWKSRSAISTIALHGFLNAGGMIETYMNG